MGVKHWYEETILPKLIDFGCAQDHITKLRAQVVPLAQGRVLEMGCGGGLNQPLYDHQKVTYLAGIDPGTTLLESARTRALEQGWEPDFRNGVGESIPFDDGEFDSVVCTYTLCSVQDQARVMAEMRRVLKPGGRLLYLEHGKAPDPGPQKWQRRIEPVWRPLMGNCHLTREVSNALRGAGYEVDPIGQHYQPKAPQWAGWMEWGTARRAGD